MKRKIIVFVTFLLTLTISVLALVGCNGQGTAKAEITLKNETTVVIKVNETEGFATLLDAMQYLKDQEELNFEITGGMVSSIEGKSNPVDWSACWMLYTSDAEMSNTEWGTTTYDGKVYGSAILGAESLSVASNEYYIWVYEIF